jgi:predicted transcriptional regulator
MAKRAKGGERVLGPLEAEVMEIVWKTEGPVSVRDLLGQVNHRRRPPLAYTTVMTVMSRLVDKDVLTRSRQGRGYIYEAAVSDQAGIAVRNVMRDFGDEATAQFVEQARGDPETLRRLQRLLAEES